ncbi:unnamed protein product [Didymodactylos carnosus]|uniref:Uncharacterized protein n=1 Tax=Didymodactylos carnosus TaxID=1234261 RepID=A0A816B9M8_9BILA|nr:unnamed protein product [Didymodactylos carnosus]CAF1606120.1 unnamed protein product [Didymodactylos carnosus]CAF4187824.1 unnamed protein product [Didymodactylos carnosus]CAF4486125.1 unnamed protein product [Didymodactylos carnosus]
MERNRTLLLASMALAALTLLFAIISLATSGWGGISIFRPTVRTAPAALGILAVLFIIASLIVTALVVFAKLSSKMSLLPIVMFFLTSLFTMGTLIGFFNGNGTAGYSYNLMATVHVFIVIAGLIAAFASGVLLGGKTGA